MQNYFEGNDDTTSIPFRNGAGNVYSQDIPSNSNNMENSKDNMSALERYRYNQMQKNMNIVYNYTAQDPQDLLNDIHQWQKAILMGQDINSLDTESRIVLQTIQEIFGQDPKSVSLDRKYQDILQVLSAWMKDSLISGISEESAIIFDTYDQVQAELGEEPKDFKVFIDCKKKLEEQAKQKQQESFFSQMSNYAMPSAKTPYERMSQILRSKESTHNQIGDVPVKQQENSFSNAQGVIKNGKNPYDNLSQMLRFYESKNNQIIPGGF